MITNFFQLLWIDWNYIYTKVLIWLLFILLFSLSFRFHILDVYVLPAGLQVFTFFKHFFTQVVFLLRCGCLCFERLQRTGRGEAATVKCRAKRSLILEFSVPVSRHGEWTQNNAWRTSQTQVGVLQTVAESEH